MKKYYKLLFALLLGFFVFLPGSRVYAEALSDIRLYSETTEVYLGPLPEYEVTTTTSHASVEAYGSNTIWLHWPDGYATWHAFGTDTPRADLNPITHYAMRICVHLEDGYEFDENTRIFFNDVDVTDQQNNSIDINTWGGYVTIDLGTVNAGEDIYTVVYDYNGGNMNGEDTHTYYWVSFAMDGTFENFMEDVTAPLGKVLDYVLVNGERKDFPFPFEINKDYTVKYMWKDIITPITQINVTGIPTIVAGNTLSTNGIRVTTPGYENVHFSWIEESTNKVMTSSDKVKDNQHYILVISDFNAAEGYILPVNLGESDIKSNLRYLMAEYMPERPEFRLYFNSVAKVKRTIKFDANGGSVKPTSKTVYTYSTYGSLPTPSRKGYTFTGWYTAKSGGSKIVAGTDTGTTGNRTLYARWSITKYKINYNLNGGSNNKKNPATYTINNKITFKNPSKKGYIFKGWFKDKKLKSRFNTINKGSTGNKSVYAKWAPITYKITYDKNGGTGSMKATTGLKYGKSYKLRGNSFKRKNYVFTGWNTKANGKGTQYKNKASIKNLTTKNNGNVKLYAQWKRITYKINYVLNGGTNNKANPSTYTGASKVTFKNPTKKGYTFLGWYSDKACKKKVTSIAAGKKGNVTLYAKWSKTNYKITYNFAGGHPNVLTVTSYTITDDVYLYEPGKDGYVFMGWYTDPELTNRIDYIPKGTTRNYTVYAKWVEETPQNVALRLAQLWLDNAPLSRSNLIQFLVEYENVEYEDAVWAADHCGADWKENALQTALIYLEGTIYSYDYLIADLQTYDDFTLEEATYAADHCGADWQEQAILKAKDLIGWQYHSRSQLITEMKNNWMFSEELAIYGVDNANIDWVEQARLNALEVEHGINGEWAFNYSRLGLIEILVINGFSEEEAAAGVDTCHFDFGEEAVAYMRRVGYEDMTRDEIIEYLEYEDFTHEEAVYAANVLIP